MVMGWLEGFSAECLSCRGAEVVLFMEDEDGKMGGGVRLCVGGVGGYIACTV